jgi:hypothetical protein
MSERVQSIASENDVHAHANLTAVAHEQKRFAHWAMRQHAAE